MEGVAEDIDGRQPAVDAVRAFDRIYTRRFGLLGEGPEGSAMSLTEVRLLYELVHGEGRTVGVLARALDVDPGHVSRTIRRLEAAGLVRRATSTTDGRQSLLAPTSKGRRTLAPIERRTRERIGALLDAVPIDRRATLLSSMERIRSVLQPAEPANALSWLIRDPRPGDIGWTVHRQAALYAEACGWNREFEGLLAGIASRFIERFDAEREHCWSAKRDDAIVGAVFVVRKSARVAQLRMLYVEPSARGMGIGTRLVDECIAFARDRGYRSMVLWTNDVLVAARRICRAAGFGLVRSEKHRSFGKELVGQYWSRDL